MLNTTHTLVGVALAQTRLKELSPRPAITAVVAANLPDIDAISALFGPPGTYIRFHRGFTHSIPGVLLLSLILALLVFGLANGKVRRRAGFARLFLFVLIAVTTHPLLDFTNSYGIRPFIPFSDRWYYGDIVPIFSLYLDAGLLVAVLLARMCRKEFAERAAILGLSYVLVFWSISAFAYNRAAARVISGGIDGRPVRELALIPQLGLNPFRWYVVAIVEPDHIYQGLISSFGNPFAFHLCVAMPRFSTAEAVERSKRAPVVQAFLGFARFPVAGVRRLAQGYEVVWIDFRGLRPETAQAFAAMVRLSEDYQILSQEYSFSRDVSPFLGENRCLKR